MSKKHKLVLCLGIVAVIIMGIVGYFIYFFATTIPSTKLEEYAETYSLRNGTEFLVINKDEIGDDFVIYVTKEKDPTETKSQEIFIFKQKKSFFPFIKRFYCFAKTPGSQTFRPADGILITPSGNNFEDGVKRNICFYSANEWRISRISYVVSRNNERVTETTDVSPDTAFFINIPGLGKTKGETVDFEKADFFNDEDKLIYTYTY